MRVSGEGYLFLVDIALDKRKDIAPGLKDEARNVIAEVLNGTAQSLLQSDAFSSRGRLLMKTISQIAFSKNQAKISLMLVNVFASTAKTYLSERNKLTESEFNDLIECYKKLGKGQVDESELFHLMLCDDKGEDKTYFDGKDLKRERKHLLITRDMKDIRSDFVDHGALVLNDINLNADTVVIGGEHAPLSDAGGGVLFQDPANTISDAEYLDERQWKDAVVVNPDITFCPDVVAYFGAQDLSKVFKGKKFKKVVFEGYFPSKVTKQYVAEIKKITADGGEVFLLNKTNDGDGNRGEFRETLTITDTHLIIENQETGKKQEIPIED